MSERITENIVRDWLKADKLCNSIHMEEQKSENPKIQKLLQHASKSGNGVGKPEFIVHGFPDIYNDIIIVNECKADIKFHKSKTGNQFAEYAVDGVKLYASYLSKEYNVIAIAVSGKDKSNLRVSHSYWKNGNEDRTLNFKEDHFYTLQELLDIIKPTIEKQLVLADLRIFAKNLNDSLHNHNIPEDKRAFLVSGILLALDDQGFIQSYKSYKKNPEDLAEVLVTTIVNKLKKQNIASIKSETLTEQYNFIKIHQGLITHNDKISGEKPQYLESIITDINENVAVYLKQSKNKHSIDGIGEMYTEFLRYANNEAKLGIVLTPSHITEFMCELINITSTDTVIDICCGTAGFLIAAMSRMIKDTKGNQALINDIKENRIVGIEVQANIHALGCANMVLHGDGKSNVIQEDCFTFSKKEKKITKALLNPPYKAKESPARQLEFIEKACDLLEQNGMCCAIVQMSCAIKSDKETTELRRRLLSKHTLQAVISMPDDLFYPIGVVTCIMVFKAHQLHPANYKTWFGYLKNDGFEKRKHQGRIDYKDKWANIKQEFINLYINRDIKNGLSVLQHVTNEDEWCAEAYMETDYSQLTQEHFEETLRKYASFLVGYQNES